MLGSLVNSNLESRLGKGPGQCVHSTGESSNCSFRDSPLSQAMNWYYHFGHKNAALGFTLVFLQCYLFQLVSHRILLSLQQLARLPWLKNSKTCSLSYLKCCLICLLSCRHGIQAVPRQVSSKVRGLLSCYWSLKKTSSI